MDQTITIKHEIKLSEEFIGDVMVTMVESGYDSLFYWGTPTHIERDDTGIPHIIALFEDEQGEDVPPHQWTVYTVTSDMIAPAIEKIINERLVGSGYMHYLMRAVMDCDAGDIDATLADCILQVAALGEVRYG